MVHGLLWLPLLIFFFWITWAGWNEYQKVETYKQWATQFDRSKYDIFAALGQTEAQLIWGLPTRQGIVNEQSVTLDHIHTVHLITKGDAAFASTAQGTAQKSEAFLQLQLTDGQLPQIPFTDADIAQQWCDFLTKTVANVGDQVQ